MAACSEHERYNQRCRSWAVGSDLHLLFAEGVAASRAEKAANCARACVDWFGAEQSSWPTRAAPAR